MSLFLPKEEIRDEMMRITDVIVDKAHELRRDEKRNLSDLQRAYLQDAQDIMDDAQKKRDALSDWADKEWSNKGLDGWHISSGLLLYAKEEA